MIIEIDPNAGFCHGVVRAIKIAEQLLEKSDYLYCLGDIVHNGNEVSRLNKNGLITIENEEYKKLKNTKILFRAHGEAPEQYKYAKENNIEIIDATCPVVLTLQKKIKKGFEEIKKVNGQIVIFGKKGHAEVIGLEGQTNNEAIVISNLNDLDLIDFSKPLLLYAQTTKDTDVYASIINEIKKRYKKNNKPVDQFFKSYQTICKQVSNRKPILKEFCSKHDVIIFVSGQKSSNGKVLFEYCKNINSNSYFVSFEKEIQPEWFTGAKSVGISGATSTPKWLMEKIFDKINSFNT